MRRSRNIALAGGAVLLLVLIIVGFQPPPQRVDMATVAHGPLRVSIDEEGKTRVIDRYVVSAPVAAYARRVDLNVGDSIAQGQVLTQLEPLPSAVLDPRSRAEAEARVQAAEAAFDAGREKAVAAQAEAELARQEYNRIVDLCKVQCASKEQEDIALTKVRSSEALEQSAQFAVKIARYELEAAKTALAYAGTKGGELIDIGSPTDGSVLKVFRESEGVIGAGEPLVEVGNPRQLEVEVDVLSADAVRISPGTPVLFERWGGGEPLEGRVRTIEPVGFTKISALGVEEQRVLVISELVSRPALWQRLGDGYRVEAVFILWQDDNVLLIPSSSLFRHNTAQGPGWAVFAVQDGRAKLTPVTLGQRNGLQAQVLSGLKAGDTVITHPSEAIEDGVEVEKR